MTFPTIPTGGRRVTGVQADTSATRTFPDLSGLTKNAGDLLIAIVIAYQSTATANQVWSGWSAGWTEFADFSQTTNGAIGAAYKWSDGTETGTISVTEAATITGHACFILLSIPGAHPSTPPEAGAPGFGTTSVATSGLLDPAGWGTEDTLWIAVSAGGEQATTGSFTGVGVTPPATYGSIVNTAISQDAVGGVNGAAAFKQANAASDNPSGFTHDTSDARNFSVTMAVRPAPAAIALTVQDADQAQTADNVDLVQHHVLVVQDATQDQTADNVVLTVGGGAVALTVQDADQAQTADNVDLVQHNVLTVQDAAQAQLADNVALTQHHVLVVQDALQAQTADNVALTQHHVLVVQDALQAQTADNVVVTPHAPGAVSLVVQDAAQAQTADNVALTQHHVLVVQDALQAQTADNVVLILPSSGAEPPAYEAYLRAPASEAGIAGSTGPAAASGGGRGGW